MEKLLPKANEMVKYELLKGTTAASVVLDTATRKAMILIRQK